MGSRALKTWRPRRLPAPWVRFGDYGPDPKSEGKDPAAVALGRKGGKARAEGMSAKRRKEIARQAAKERWKKASLEP